MKELILWVVLLGACISSGVAHETIVDDARGFRLSLPEGYVINEEIVSSNPNIAHAFMTRDADEYGSHILLMIEPMKKPIGPQRLTMEHLPAGFNGKISTIKWRGFDVDVIEIPEEANGVPTLTFNVQIPLKKAAIQLKLFGAARRKAELENQLALIVNGLEGETNWIPGVSQVAAKVPSEQYGTLLVAFAVVFIVGGLVALLVLSRFTPKGTVLAIAAAIYCASWSLEGAKTRESLALSGSMRMLGFAGGILGIVDLLRKRPMHKAGFSAESPINKQP